MIAGIQIDGGDATVGRLPEWKALHRLNRSHLLEVVGIGYRRLRQRGRV